MRFAKLRRNGPTVLALAIDGVLDRPIGLREIGQRLGDFDWLELVWLSERSDFDREFRQYEIATVRTAWATIGEFFVGQRFQPDGCDAGGFYFSNERVNVAI